MFSKYICQQKRKLSCIQSTTHMQAYFIPKETKPDKPSIFPSQVNVSWKLTMKMMRRPAKTYVTRRVCASSQKTDGTESRSALPWYERGGAKIVHLLGSSHKTKERPPFKFVKSSCAAWRAHFRLLKNSNSSFFSLCSYLRLFVSLFVCLTSLELMGSWVCAA
jgi:hypothetical protein